MLIIDILIPEKMKYQQIRSHLYILLLVRGKTLCCLLVTFCRLLVTSARSSLLFGRCSLLSACYTLLSNRFFVTFTRSMLQSSFSESFGYECFSPY